MWSAWSVVMPGRMPGRSGDGLRPPPKRTPPSLSRAAHPQLSTAMCCCCSRPAPENLPVASAGSGATRRNLLQRPSSFPATSLSSPQPRTRRHQLLTGARDSGSAIGVHKITEARAARCWCSPTPSDLARPDLHPFRVLHPMSPRTGPQQRRFGAFDTFPAEFSRESWICMTG